MQALFHLREFLARKAAAVAALREHLIARPSLTTLQAQGTVAAGSGLRTIRVRDHRLISDSSPALGGYDVGPNAPELLLAAMASCIVHSTLMLAAERGLALEHVSVDVSAAIDYRGTLGVAGAPVAPSGFSYVLHYRGAVDPAAMERLQQDLPQVCPVLQALIQPQTLSGTISQA